MAITLLITGATAFVIAKYNNWAIRALEKFYMVAMMVPAVLMLVPLYYFADSMRMTDSLIWLSIIYAIQGMPFSVFLLAGFMRGIHNALLEAATIVPVHAVFPYHNATDEAVPVCGGAAQYYGDVERVYYGPDLHPGRN